MINNEENKDIDVAMEVTYSTHMLTNTREDLTEESKGIMERRKCKCYTANIQVAGILTKALIDTGAEITCISEEFFNGNKERFQHYPCGGRTPGGARQSV